MAIGRITYEDKIDSLVNEQDPKHKITAQDMNEIKQVFNESAEDIEFATENLGDYKVENGVIYFKKADGSYNQQGVSLAGQSTILDGNGNVILSGHITPNDNLLTNSDFKSGIINQKGQTSYTGISYGIDMWLGATTSTKITVNKGYISLLGTMRQFVNTIPFKTGDKYTVCVNVNGTDNVWTFDYKEGVTQHAFSNFTVEVNMNTSNDRILFQIISTSSINIYYVKMEKGSYFTGMPVWNEAEELLKCMYLFEKKAINVMCSQFEATTCYANIPYSIPKIKTPSITGKCTWIGSNTGEGIGETKITKLEATAIQKEYVDIKVTHESANFGQYSRNVFVELYIDSYSY